MAWFSRSLFQASGRLKALKFRKKIVLNLSEVIGDDRVMR